MADTLAPELDVLAKRLRLLLPPLLSTQRSSWEQGICAQAMLECHRFLSETAITPESLSLPYDFVQWLYALAHDALVRQASDGRLAALLNGDGTSDTGALDAACIGDTLYYLCTLEAQSLPLFPSPCGAVCGSLLDGVGKMLDYIMHTCPRAPVDVGSPEEHLLLSHRTDSVQIWSDSVYMLPPFLVSAAVYHALPLTHPLSKDLPPPPAPRTLLRMALQQIKLAAKYLQTPSGAWAHIYDHGTGAFKRAALWGVGNGWVCCGIMRVLCTLVSLPSPSLAALGLDPATDGAHTPLLQDVYAILLRTLDATLAHELPSHLFRDVLDDSDGRASFPETNLPQMLAYSLFRLADLHQHQHQHQDCAPRFPGALGLPPARAGQVEAWVARAGAMREAAVGMTDRWGFVRDVCGSPGFDRPGTAAEGQAWGVLMEVARAQYLTHKRRAMYGGESVV
ncbi:hypothetical protein C8Q77DRAFT_558224 [Trametes polyzona]|nr:hypothetical protein C8Q77DRAFT_558224 [Trametes polyzona]